MTPITKEEIKTIINLKWTYAKSIPWAPHWYIVKKENPSVNYEGFFWYIQTHGALMAWGKQPVRKYLVIGEYRYWAMTEDVRISRILNRERLGKHNKGRFIDESTGEII